MLKMYIDNEEVVSKNDFTIKEEMLSASSTILNNTYPKTWELDKDYISRFYYPKDYSKLILNKDTYYPHLDGETIEGTSFQIQADTTLEDEYYFKGNTTQNGTPTPSTPIPVETATGLQDVNVTRKNLYGANGSGVVGNVNVSITNGKIIFNGTANATIQTSANSWRLLGKFVLPAGTYYFSQDYTSNVRLYDSSNAIIITNNGTFTTTKQDTYYLGFYFASGTVFNNLEIKLQIEKGQVGTQYEPYIGNKYSINLGKNLVNTIAYNKTANSSGIVQNASSPQYYLSIDDYVKVEPNTTYTISFENDAGGNLFTSTKDNSGTFIARTNLGATRTFTTGSNVYQVFLYIYKSGGSYTDVGGWVQLEKGNVATPYSLYFTPIELNKIGTYQDRIFKNTLTSPYYDSNLELDKWYLYKEIGKYIFTGIETWYKALTGTNTNLYYTQLTYISADVLSQYFTRNDDLYNQDVEGMRGVTSNNRMWFRISNTTASDANAFKTWLSTHNTIVYYVLATPTCNEITNTTLISELESIRLLNGLNNISITSANLPMIMNLHYNFQIEHTDVEPIFSGMVKNTSNISLNPREPKYCSLEILDYKTLLSEGKTLDYVISNKTILEAITMVVNSISEYGFELGNVNILNGDEIIGAYSTENKTAYDVLQYLADISGAKWNCRRKDDTSMYIDFYDPTLMPRGTQIEYTTEWACENNLVDLKFNYGTRDYRNKQIILSDEVEGSIEYNDRLASDGVNKEYTLPYKIATLDKIEIDGEEQTIATREEKEVGIYADFYYSRDTDTFTSNKLLPYGTLIDVSYTPIIKGREVIQNDSEIDRLTNQLEVNGTISRYENRNDTTDSNKLINIGETYLKYKGEAEITLTIKTFNNNLYNIGQVVYFNAPIPELQKDYLVKSKQIQVVSSDENELNIFYTFTLSSSFNAEKEINWFDNQRAKNEGNIGEGEFISRNIDINNKANIIWDNLRVEEVELPIGASNDLQASLEAPFIH